MMKPIMSFWSEPYKRGFCTSWLQHESWYYSWLLSYKYVTKHFGLPTIYTDDYGIELLQNKLNLTFAEIVNFEGVLPSQFSRFYSLARAYACAQQNEKFIHIDYDTFLIDELPQEIKDAEIYCEKIIKNSNPDIIKIKHFNGCERLPVDFIFEDRSDIIKTGIFGGDNHEYFTKYYNTYIDILYANDSKFNNEYLRFSSEMHDGKVFRPHLALSYYLPSYIAKSMKLTFETLNYDNNTIKCRYAHASSDKELHVDLRGRMIQRLVNEFPDTTNIIKNLTHENDVKIPTVDVVVVPVVESPCYETVVRAIVPRNVKPDSLTVSMYNMSSDDYSLLRKLDSVRIMFGQKSHFSSFSAIASRTKNDLIILIDGHIKVPALYIEKSISAYLDNKNAIYCATAANLSDSKQNIHGGSISEEKINIITQEKSKDYTAVDVLLGGLYVMSRATFLKILNTDNNITNFVDLSHIATKLSIPLLCMNNLVVDHNRKIDISTLLTHQ